MQLPAAVLAFVVSAVVSACGIPSIGPMGDDSAGHLGCQQPPPPGVVVPEAEPIDPGQPLAGLDVQAMTGEAIAAEARSKGLRVGWRYQYAIGEERPGTAQTGYSECWCIQPPDGEVIALFYGSAGEVVIMLQGQRRPAVRPQPPRGWGC